MKVTMETIAKQVGVSRNAVSLAMRNHPSISQATRNKILAAAAELGYQRNPAYGELMSQMRLKGHGSTQATLALFNANKNPMAFANTPPSPCMSRAAAAGRVNSAIRSTPSGFINRIPKRAAAPSRIAAAPPLFRRGSRHRQPRPIRTMDE